MIHSGNPRKLGAVGHVAILLVLILGIVGCNPTPASEESRQSEHTATALATFGIEDATPTPFVEPSASLTPSPTDTPNPPTPTAQLLTTRVSTADPSGAALLLRDQAVAPDPP